MSRETLKVKRMIREHSLEPLYLGRQCMDCRKFDEENRYCKKWLRCVKRTKYACEYFSPRTRIYGSCLQIFISKMGTQRRKCYSEVKSFIDEMKKLVEKSGLKMSFSHLRKKWMNVGGQKTVMYRTKLTIYSPHPSFSKKLTELLPKWYQKLSIEVKQNKVR